MSGSERREIWLSHADGSSPARLTRGPGRAQGSPRWSPDGRSIAFDSQAESGHADIWTIGADGSRLHQITHDPADDIQPSWSRDGRSIYLTSKRTSRNEVRRVPAGGGAEEQVAREGGDQASESPDGRTLYYRRADGALVTRPTAGGESERFTSPAIAAGVRALGGIGPQGCRESSRQGRLRRSPAKATSPSLRRM